MLLLMLLSACSVPGNHINDSCLFGDCFNDLSIKKTRFGLYVGEMNNGYRQGKGSYSEYSTHMKYYGDWENDKKHGEGTLTTPQGLYSGSWHYGQPTKITFTGDSGVFKGELKIDGGFRYPYIFPVEGETTWPNGAKYQGHFGCINVSRCGLPLGEGIYRSPSGDIISGTFTSTSKTGFVELENGKKIYFTFENNESMSPITFKFANFTDIEPVSYKIDRFLDLTPSR